MPFVHFLPSGVKVEVSSGTTLLEASRKAGLAVDSPCGGHGKCGKCTVRVEDKPVLSCQEKVVGDVTVFLSGPVQNVQILSGGIAAETETNPVHPGKYLAAIDIGTTTMVCFLLDPKTQEKVASSSMLNPQYPFGADVVSRIQAARDGKAAQLTDVVREGMLNLLRQVCTACTPPASLQDIGTICFVGNPAMQQLFLGLPVDNLASPPFPRLLDAPYLSDAASFLAPCENAKLLTLPDIAGYVGGDTMGCVLATRMYEQAPFTLLLDIGTNGEMVLGNEERLAATSTAAGPALEGAGITFGMRGAPGAIDRVHISDQSLSCHVIGEQKAEGICGSGLIDAAAALLNLGILNKRGRIEKNFEEVHGERAVFLTDTVYLTQNDIRAVQMAKGAIAAGIELLAAHLGTESSSIKRVFLAGAFGSFISPASACRIGLIPPQLLPCIQAVGNAAGSGAILCALNREEFEKTRELVKRIEPVELSTQSAFQKTFARQMMFTTV